MAGMMLADLGAEVILIERGVVRSALQEKDPSFRGKRSLALNLKDSTGIAALLRLIEKADVLIDPYRSGVTERLGIGPAVCHERNAKLIYGRITGWGQDGPLAPAAGHDINYIALTGALFAIGRRHERPTPPLNLVGDMGGGGMLLAYGIVCALIETRSSGIGQVVDAAMVDGAAQMMWMLHGLHAAGAWNAGARGVNLLDGGAHFYDTYETSDGKYGAVGAIEPQFYAVLIERMGLDKDRFARQMDKAQWSVLKDEMAAAFKTKTRDQWCSILEGGDACFAPVLSLAEAPNHQHNRARDSYIELDGMVQPAPAPRFSRTPAVVRHGARGPGADGAPILAEAGYTNQEIAELRDGKVLME